MTADPTDSNVLNIPCTQCKTGWMQVVADRLPHRRRPVLQEQA